MFYLLTCVKHHKNNTELASCDTNLYSENVYKPTLKSENKKETAQFTFETASFCLIALSYLIPRVIKVIPGHLRTDLVSLFRYYSLMK